MKILLATDGSEQSKLLASEIALRSRPRNAEIRVISVVDPSVPVAFPGEIGDSVLYEEMQKTARDRARAAVRRAAAYLRGSKGSKLKVATKVLDGSPKSVILEEAEAFGADLIVLGSHGHGLIEGLLLGSVSQAVASHAKCSVLIVRSRAWQPPSR